MVALVYIWCMRMRAAEEGRETDRGDRVSAGDVDGAGLTLCPEP